MSQPEQPVTRRRGRPPAGKRGDVHEALLLAFRECLAERSHSEVTLKDVADRAGTSQEMIRYYFGGKDGLVTALLKQATETFARSLNALEQTILEPGESATRRLLRELIRLYLDYRDVSRISVAEFFKTSSTIRAEYLADRSSAVVARIHRIIERLVDAGVYDARIDTRKMAVSIMTMVTGPVILLTTLSSEWVDAEDMAGEDWLCHLTQLVERRCLKRD